MTQGPKLSLEQAVAAMRNGQDCYAAYYGWGWSTFYDEGTGKFFDRNPHTGSSMLHDFDRPDELERDKAAVWRIGRQPKDPK